MAHRSNNVLPFPRRPRALTNGARIARILNQIWRAPPSGTGVLAVSESGELFQGRRLPEAFLWEPANEPAWTAFKHYCSTAARQRRAA